MNTLSESRTWLHRAFSIMLALASLWIGLLGLQYYLATNGAVSGSEFGMLITLVNGLGALMVWGMFYGLWQVSAPCAVTSDK